MKWSFLKSHRVRAFFAGSAVFCVSIPLLGQRGQELKAPILEKIRAAAMESDWAWEELQTLTDSIGPRASGSAQLQAAIQQVANKMRSIGARVTLQPVKIPHWIRGQERAELIDYAGRPAGTVQSLRLTALGASSSTPATGLESNVLVVRDFAELKSRSAEARGAIPIGFAMARLKQLALALQNPSAKSGLPIGFAVARLKRATSNSRASSISGLRDGAIETSKKSRNPSYSA